MRHHTTVYSRDWYRPFIENHYKFCCPCDLELIRWRSGCDFIKQPQDMRETCKVRKDMFIFSVDLDHGQIFSLSFPMSHNLLFSILYLIFTWFSDTNLISTLVSVFVICTKKQKDVSSLHNNWWIGVENVCLSQMYTSGLLKANCGQITKFRWIYFLLNTDFLC